MENQKQKNLGGRPPIVGKPLKEKAFVRLLPEQLLHLQEKYGSTTNGLRTLIERDMVQQPQKQP